MEAGKRKGGMRGRDEGGGRGFGLRYAARGVTGVVGGGGGGEEEKVKKGDAEKQGKGRPAVLRVHHSVLYRRRLAREQRKTPEGRWGIKKKFVNTGGLQRIKKMSVLQQELGGEESSQGGEKQVKKKKGKSCLGVNLVTIQNVGWR